MTNKFDRIPEELQHLRQWHVWRQTEETKIPLQVNGAAAKSNDPNTWTDFATAAEASQFFSGLAFEIIDPYCGIDLDNCFDEHGKLRSWAWPILSHFDGFGYSEISPSGRGIKILTRARKPAGAKCVHKFGDEKQQIECYDTTRFWTITGDVYSGNDHIQDGQAAIDWLCNQYLTGTAEEKIGTVKHDPAPPRINFSSLMDRAIKYCEKIPSESKGNLRNAAFKTSGHLHSLVDEFGMRLTDEEVYRLLQSWNDRNTDKLRDEELREASVNGRKNGTPRADKLPSKSLPVQYPEVDLSKLLGEERGEDFDDEGFCASMVPDTGLVKKVFDFYCQTSHRTSCVMGLAVAVSLCETIFGRRITSHTDMRTNDYNVIMAPTASGKEACETTLAKIFNAAGNVPMLPPDVQSGNGLLKAVHEIPCGIWVCDEFGKMLEAVIDRKSNNGHAKQIGTHLLKLYSKSAGTYGGASHADGIRNAVEQPHLVLLGLTTGQIFETIDSRQIQDGLFGRIAFWPVQSRPKRKTARSLPVPESIHEVVRAWQQWEPVAGVLRNFDPQVIEMDQYSSDRWDKHADAIDEKMEHESESRAAIWGRVAARAMKLALVHRAARIDDDPAIIDWQFIRIEKQDIDWAIKLANWLARVACGLIRENVHDVQAARARHVLKACLEIVGSISRREIMREYRSISGSEFTAAAEALQAEGILEITTENTGGRSKVIYKSR